MLTAREDSILVKIQILVLCANQITLSSATLLPAAVMPMQHVSIVTAVCMGLFLNNAMTKQENVLAKEQTTEANAKIETARGRRGEPGLLAHVDT